MNIFDDGQPQEEGNIKPVSGAREDAQRSIAVAIENFRRDGGDVSKITASGYGELAEQILALAFQNDVKVREDKDLAQMLAAIEVDSEIPAEALIAVAEILSYVYRINGEYDRARIVKDNARYDQE